MPVQPSPEEPAAATAERRLVSVLFADVVGSTALADRMDPEDWSGIIRQVIEIMARSVSRYGGTVVRVMGDGVLAVFGAPTAHEDDAIRAIHAGLDMVGAVTAAGPALQQQAGTAIEIRVGINTGLAIVEAGAADSGPSDVLGDTVNVAARMQSTARPGTVLVTAETWGRSESAFVATDLGGIEVKGKAEPVVAWEVEGPRGDPGSGRGLVGLASPLVGRDEPLLRLTAALEATRRGLGRGAVVLGDPGVGKSRLLAELRARNLSIGEDGLRWIEARSVSYGADVPYGLFSDVVRAALNLRRGAAPRDQLAALGDRVTDLIDADAAAHLATLGHLLSLPLPDAVGTELAPLSPEALRLRYLSSAEIVLRRLAAERSLAVVLDDIHWADASSVELLTRLLPLVHELPLLIVISGRPDRGQAGWLLVEAARAALGDGLTEATLEPLGLADSRSLVSNLLEVDSLPERLRDFILSSAEGNPFFVEEVIRMLMDRGWIEQRDGRWVGSDTIASAEIPPTLEGLLTARIDRLPAPFRRILRVAAVIGRDVPVGLLESVVGERPSVAAALSQAEAAGLVRIGAIDPEPVYRFRHALIQEAAYGSLLKADRRRLHRQVGEAIESREPERLDELAPILGLHFERGGENERAVDYLHRAGRDAMRRFAVHEARDLLDRAATLLIGMADDDATDRRRIEVDLDRVTAGLTFIPYDQALSLLATTRARAERIHDDRLLGLTLAREAATLNLQGADGASAAFEAALEGAITIGRRLGDPAILGHPLAIKGLLLAGVGRRAEAIEVLEQGIRQLEKIEAASAAFYTGQLGVLHAELGDFPAAARAAARARALAERSGDPNALADVDIFEGMALAMEGRHAEALALAHRGASGANAIGNLGCEATGSFVAGEQELALGNFASAIDWLEKANGIAVYCRAADVERLSAATLKAARAMAGEGVEALHGLDSLLEQTRRVGDRLSEGRILLRRAEAHAVVAHGDPDEARSDLEAATAIFRAIGAPSYLERAERLRASLSPDGPS